MYLNNWARSAIKFVVKHLDENGKPTLDERFSQVKAGNSNQQKQILKALKMYSDPS